MLELLKIGGVELCWKLVLVLLLVLLRDLVVANQTKSFKSPKSPTIAIIGLIDITAVRKWLLVIMLVVVLTRLGKISQS